MARQRGRSDPARALAIALSQMQRRKPLIRGEIGISRQGLTFQTPEQAEQQRALEQITTELGLRGQIQRELQEERLKSEQAAALEREQLQQAGAMERLQAQQATQQQGMLERILLKGQIEAAQPLTAEEKLDQLTLGLAQQAIAPAEPTAEQAEAAVPEALRTILGQPGMVAVPGPEGGIVLGRGQVAPGQPTSEKVVRERAGLPQARAQQEAQRAQAQQGLSILQGVGLTGRGGAAEFPATATQREAVEVARSRRDAADAVANGEMEVETAIDLLVESHPQLDRAEERMKLLLESTTRQIR